MRAQLAQLAECADYDRGRLAHNEAGAGLAGQIRCAIGQYLAAQHMRQRPPAG
jgi:hypothetical protein